MWLAATLQLAPVLLLLCILYSGASGIPNSLVIQPRCTICTEQRVLINARLCKTLASTFQVVLSSASRHFFFQTCCSRSGPAKMLSQRSAPGRGLVCHMLHGGNLNSALRCACWLCPFPESPPLRSNQPSLTVRPVTPALLLQSSSSEHHHLVCTLATELCGKRF